MRMMRILTRPVVHGLAVVLLLSIMAGCSSQKPVDAKQASKEPAPKKSLQLNPLDWDFKQAGYDFREKYNFKLGNMWIIKPPRQFNPSQVVVVRALGKLPAEPKAQLAVNELYNQYVQQKDATSTADMIATPSQAREASQMMVINLITSDAILFDADGREYPSQVDPGLTHQLVELTTDPKWLLQKRGKIKLVSQDDWAYRGLFQESASAYKPVPRNWKISETSVNADVTETQRLLTQAFEVAHRAVHPLSESVNLLK